MFQEDSLCSLKDCKVTLLKITAASAPCRYVSMTVWPLVKSETFAVAAGVGFLRASRKCMYCFIIPGWRGCENVLKD